MTVTSLSNVSRRDGTSSRTAGHKTLRVGLSAIVWKKKLENSILKYSIWSIYSRVSQLFCPAAAKYQYLATHLDAKIGLKVNKKCSLAAPWHYLTAPQLRTTELYDKTVWVCKLIFNLIAMTYHTGNDCTMAIVRVDFRVPKYLKM